MSEPVGNSPRGTNIPSNSHKVREEQPKKAASPTAPGPDKPAKEETTKIIEGKVMIRKPAWYKRAARSMLADDATNVGDFIVADVIIPGVKQLFRNALVGTIDRAMFGAVRPGQSIGIGQSIISGGLAGAARSQLGMRYDKMAEGQNALGMNQQQRARHAFNEITLPELGEANFVIEAMVARILTYGACSVADLYGFLGATPNSYMDRGFGWTDLSTATVRQTGAGWMLDLPKPEPLRS